MATVELSVFGLGSQVDVTSETLALAGVVGFTVAFEMVAHRLEHRLAGTPYMGMLAKIYKGKPAGCSAKCGLIYRLALIGLRGIGRHDGDFVETHGFLLAVTSERTYEYPPAPPVPRATSFLLALCVTRSPTVVDNPELMIMGFISLGVFLTLQFGGVGSTIGFYTFEFAHIVVFFTTLIFVMQVRAPPNLPV